MQDQNVQKDAMNNLIAQFATLIGDGRSLVDALSTTARAQKDERLKQVLLEIQVQVNSMRLSEAFAQYPDVFEERFIAAIRRAEGTGALDDELKRYVAVQGQ